jgi:DNA-binding IclR family transcriptional regulator
LDPFTGLRGTALALCHSEMDNTSSGNAQSWTRLESYLASLHPGDVITVNDTIENTDLAPETVHIVLAALTKADLFERNGDRFTRRQAISYGSDLVAPVRDRTRTAAREAHATARGSDPTA